MSVTTDAGGDTRERVILVDESDREIGTAGKLEAHAEGKLHRAFSIQLRHPDGRMLLQRRALSKYHSGGLWSNTCCGHPRPGESIEHAARRRLQDEMGVECPLEVVAAFTYRSDLGDGLEEHEIDHVLEGRFAGTPVANPAEVAEWSWVSADAVEADVRRHPDRYTAWFARVLDVLRAG